MRPLPTAIDTPFLEIGALSARGQYDGGVHKAGTIAGIGMIEGRTCVISVNDATVKGGTVYPLGVKKALRLQAIGMENRLPFVSIVDSGGAFLPLQSEEFPDIDAGGAYMPAMSDELVHVRGTGAIFLGGPPLVTAATGRSVRSCGRVGRRCARRSARWTGRSRGT